MATAARKRTHQHNPLQRTAVPAATTFVPPPMPRVLQHVTKSQLMAAAVVPQLNPRGPMQAISNPSSPPPAASLVRSSPAAPATSSSSSSVPALSGSTAAASTSSQQPDYDDHPIWEQLLQGSPDGRRMELARLLRRYNYSLPGLQGQAVQATVLRVGKDSVLVDPGFYGVAEVPRSEVTLAALCKPPRATAGASTSSSGGTADGTVATANAMSASTPAFAYRKGLSDVRPGDVVSLKVEALFTPYGDMALAAADAEPTTRRTAAWQELQEAKAAQRPVLGRVLNACTGGYAVGIGGLVALLPYGRFTLETVAAIGVLQQFMIEAVDPGRNLLTVADVRKGSSRRLVETRR